MQSAKPITMQVQALRDKCKDYEDQTQRLANLSDGIQTPRPNCFSDIHNNAILAAELLHYYYYIWNKPRFGLTPEQVTKGRRDNGARVMATLKHLFVFSLSAMEYRAKERIKAYPNDSEAHNLLKAKLHYPNLRTIMDRSMTQELIGKGICEEWGHIIDIRNWVVHNNAVADKTKTYRIDGLIIETSKDEMMKGKLNFYLTLTDLAVDRYFNWMKKLIAEYGG